MQRTLGICFDDLEQLKEDLAEYIEHWSCNVHAGDELLLRVAEPILGRKK